MKDLHLSLSLILFISNLFFKVELFVATPSNIPAESFEAYGVALALVAQAFVGKKPHLIQDADNLFHQLQQTKVTKYEECSLCLYSHGDGEERS
jgi:hypothetical protein